MKKKVFIIALLVFIAVPQISYAAVNPNAEELIYNSSTGAKICPDFHYILDDEYPYLTVLPGNNQTAKSSYQYYGLLDYDFVVYQSTKPLNVHNTNITANKGSVKIYAANSSDETWQYIGDVYQSIVYKDVEEFPGNVFCCNWDILKAYDDSKFQSEAYSYFVYYRDLYGSSDEENRELSAVDYNGRKMSFALTYIKLISHVFVNDYLKPLIDTITAEPVFLAIVLICFVVGILPLLFYLFSILSRRRSRKV